MASYTVTQPALGMWESAVVKCFTTPVCEMLNGKNAPSVHGEVSVEHPLAHLLLLNSPGELQVRELIS